MNTLCSKSLATTAICFLLFSFMLPQGAMKGTVDITDGRTETNIEPVPVTHSAYDVVVLRTKQFYKITYYGKERAPYSYHAASYGSKKDFDKAQYQWLNDSTIAIKLYSTKTKKTAKLKVWGKDNKSGMETE